MEHKNDYVITGERILNSNKNIKSSIILTETSAKIHITGVKVLMPVGVVPIIPNIELEIGRSIEEFKGYIKKLRKPLAFQKISAGGGLETYRIIRLQTGKVPEVAICTLTIKDKIIIGVSFNQALNYNKEYRKYEELSIAHRLTAGKEGQIGLFTRAIKSLVLLCGANQRTFEIQETNKGIYIEIPGYNNKDKIKYSFVKDKNRYYNLLSISLVI